MYLRRYSLSRAYREKSENVSEREKKNSSLCWHHLSSHANYRNTCYDYLKLVYSSLIEHEASIKDDYHRDGSAQCKIKIWRKRAMRFIKGWRLFRMTMLEMIRVWYAAHRFVYKDVPRRHGPTFFSVLNDNLSVLCRREHTLLIG